MGMTSFRLKIFLRIFYHIYYIIKKLIVISYQLIVALYTGERRIGRVIRPILVVIGLIDRIFSPLAALKVISYYPLSISLLPWPMAIPLLITAN